MTSEKREKAIKYLTEEIRSLRMAPQINGCGPENWEEQLEIMETCLEAVRSAHFAEAGKMQPLTVEQLREVVGKPYWHVGLHEDSPKPHWEILDPFVSKHPEDYGYGKRWLAYAYPPAHIDREAWVSVEEKLPDAEEEVRLLCVTSWGRHYQCQGFYVPPGTYRDDSGYSWGWECCKEYNEERDDYLVNPGWYESIHNWDEYSACGIADKVTNWMPLPEEPEDMEKRARGIEKDGT